MFFFFKQKTAYEMRISDWSSDVCSSDLLARGPGDHRRRAGAGAAAHTGGDEDHVLAFDVGEDLVECLLGRATPDVRARTGAAPLGDVTAKMDAAAEQRMVERMSIGVGVEEHKTLTVSMDHFVAGFGAGPAYQSDAGREG